MRSLNRYGVIYKVTNKINGKVYIGQTVQSFDKRYGCNIYKWTHNLHLKRSIEKYGIENFEIDKEFDVAYSKEELNNKEIQWIKYYNATDSNFGYNIRSGGNTLSERDRKLQSSRSKIYHEYHIKQINIYVDNEYYMTSSMSYKDISNMFDISVEVVRLLLSFGKSMVLYDEKISLEYYKDTIDAGKPYVPLEEIEERKIASLIKEYDEYEAQNYLLEKSNDVVDYMLVNINNNEAIERFEYEGCTIENFDDEYVIIKLN